MTALFGMSVAAQERAADRGQEVFAYWCAPCHSAGPRNPGTIALEVRYQGSKPAALEERTDLVPELTKTFVRNGLSIMPPFRKTEISDADLEALAAYLARPSTRVSP
jgi:mono/diheme cytochrome c family protein